LNRNPLVIVVERLFLYIGNENKNYITFEWAWKLHPQKATPYYLFRRRQAHALIDAVVGGQSKVGVPGCT